LFGADSCAALFCVALRACGLLFVILVKASAGRDAQPMVDALNAWAL
jgi:hypothetical protein